MKLPGVLTQWWAQGCGSCPHSFMSALNTEKDQHQEMKRPTGRNGTMREIIEKITPSGEGHEKGGGR